MLPEGGLQGMEALGRGHALDRGDGRAVGLDGEHRAGLDGLAVEVDRAGAALRGVAADVGAREVQVLAEELDQEPSGLDIHLPGNSVDDERNMLVHGSTSFRHSACAGHDDVVDEACAGALGPSALVIRSGGRDVAGGSSERR